MLAEIYLMRLQILRKDDAPISSDATKTRFVPIALPGLDGRG